MCWNVLWGWRKHNFSYGRHPLQGVLMKQMRRIANFIVANFGGRVYNSDGNVCVYIRTAVGTIPVTIGRPIKNFVEYTVEERKKSEGNPTRNQGEGGVG